MMRRLCLTLLLICACSLLGAQTFGEYLRLRKAYKVAQAAEVAALETLVGTRVLEVKGTITGCVSSGSSGILMLRATSGENLPIESEAIPEWLRGNQIEARLLVRAERTSEGAMLRATLLGAANEWQMREFEKTQAKSVRELQAKTAKGKKSRTVAYVLPDEKARPVYSRFIRSRNPRLGVDEADRIAKGVLYFSRVYGVDPRLIMAMVLVESGFNPSATSRAGAMGLGQLMPGTARGMGVGNAYDSVQNLFGTVRLVRGHLEKYNRQTGGDSYRALTYALAAYNAGGGAVQRHGGVPPYRETQNYVAKVINVYRRLIGS